jgi:hypothetical protein
MTTYLSKALLSESIDEHLDRVLGLLPNNFRSKNLKRAKTPSVPGIEIFNFVKITEIGLNKTNHLHTD